MRPIIHDGGSRGGGDQTINNPRSGRHFDHPECFFSTPFEEACQ
jgi:hypothetical protein